MRDNLEFCPHCDANLQGATIDPKHLLHKEDCQEQSAKYNGRCYCLPYGEVSHFSRKIGCEIQGVYDGVLYNMCPDCGGTWHRWGDDNPTLKAAAEKYIISGIKPDAFSAYCTYCRGPMRIGYEDGGSGREYLVCAGTEEDIDGEKACWTQVYTLEDYSYGKMQTR